MNRQYLASFIVLVLLFLTSCTIPPTENPSASPQLTLSPTPVINTILPTSTIPPSLTLTPSLTSTQTPSSNSTPSSVCVLPAVGEELLVLHQDRIYWTDMPLDLIQGVGKRLEVKYPDFYHIKQSLYDQQLDKTTDYDDAWTIIWQASGAEKDYINPIVVLVTVGESLGWNPSPDGDLYNKAKNIRLALLEYVNEFQQNPDIRSRNPAIGNAASYAIYTYFASDREKIYSWCQEYNYLTGQDPSVRTTEKQ